jgi:hypothetical protein
MKIDTFYICEKCGLKSRDENEIASCEAIPMRPSPVAIGDVVISTSGGYGWWKDDESWFHFFTDEEKKEREPNFGHHCGIGNPTFVVVDIRPYGELGSNVHGKYAHRMVPILYSPSHANRGERRIAFGWTGEHIKTIGKVAPAELAKFQKLAKKEGRSEYFSH